MDPARLIMADNSRQAVRSDDECTGKKTRSPHLLEAKLQIADCDRSRDRQLNISELSHCLRFVPHPDLRGLRSWDRYSLYPKRP